MRKQKFFKKVVWITGASSGIGEACAYLFAEEGASLILTGRSNDALNKVGNKCAALGASCKTLSYNLSNLDQIHALVDEAFACFGTIDVIFNNAGISQRALAGDTMFSVDRLIMDVNYFAPVLISKHALPKLIEQGGGTIAVTTSISGRFGFPLRSAYSASKHALYGYFETLHAEYFEKNIRVVFVCPGRVKTNISFNALKNDGQQHALIDEGQASGISAEKAARKIVNAVNKRKPEVLIGGKELFMVYIKRFFPGLTRKLIRKIKPT